MLNFCQWFQRF